jgi:hypothetical protein
METVTLDEAEYFIRCVSRQKSTYSYFSGGEDFETRVAVDEEKCVITYEIKRDIDDDSEFKFPQHFEENFPAKDYEKLKTKIGKTIKAKFVIVR